jgi:penicillin V acylase-like amidase (Ntn superfamily)
MRAWRIFQQVCTRFVSETQTAAVVLTRATQDWAAEDVDDLMTRLGVLYKTIFPQKRTKRGA